MQMLLLAPALELLCSLGMSVYSTAVPERRLSDSYANSDTDLGDVFGTMMVLVVAVVVLGLLSMVSSVVFACVYKNKVVRNRAQMPPVECARPNGDFAMKLYSCCDDTSACMHAAFCPACRAGDTYQAAGVSSYWNVIALYVGCQVLGSLIGGVLSGAQDHRSGSNVTSLVTSLLLGLAFYNMRRRLRAKLGGQEDALPWLQDFVSWAFCACCVIAQEARSVDMATGVRVTCCCNLAPNAIRAPLVGNPVVEAPVHEQPLQAYPIQAQPAQPYPVQGQQALHCYNEQQVIS